MLRARFWGSLAGVVLLLVPLALTLLATSFAALMVSDTYAGVEMVAGRGIPGTYVVTVVECTLGKCVSSGTFTSDDGTVVLEGAKYSWGDNDLGATSRAQYVPSLRTGRLPIAVSPGVWGDIVGPAVGGVLAIAVAGAGWWLMGTMVRGILTPAHDDPEPCSDATSDGERRIGRARSNDGAE